MVKNINVPESIMYLSEFNTYEDGTPVEFKNCILNKGCTGVGGTHKFLTDDVPTVICSPRVSIIESKAQEFGERILAVQKGVCKLEIESYLNKCKDAPKIITTDVSFGRVKTILGKNISKYRVVIDEYHKLLDDCSFRSDNIYDFLDELKDIKNKIFISATPIEERFLKEMPILCDMDIVNLVWSNLPKLYVERIKTNNPILMAQHLVGNWKSGFTSTISSEMKDLEYIFFNNSVRDNVSVVKNTNLSIDEVAIYTGKSDDNNKYISTVLGEEYTNATIPKKGEKHKPITFWTSTMECGADWYSDNAHIFVVSDTNRTHTSIDLNGQIVQIAGRLRNKQNPNVNHITLIYNTPKGNLEDKLQEIRDRWDRSVKLLDELWFWLGSSNSVALDYAKKAAISLQKENNYSNFYVRFDEKNNTFMLNRLKFLNDIKMCEVQYGQYKNINFVDDLMKENGYVLEGKTKVFHDYVNHVRISVNNVFEERMQQFVEIMTSGVDDYEQIAKEFSGDNHEHYKRLYDVVGPEKIKSLNYKKAAVKREFNLIMSDEIMQPMIDEKFVNDSCWIADDIKNELKSMFNSIPGIEVKSLTAKLLKRYGIVLKRKKISVAKGSRREEYRITRPSCS